MSMRQLPGSRSSNPLSLVISKSTSRKAKRCTLAVGTIHIMRIVCGST